ncbi:MAG: thioesterase family protein, partial [Chloroflexota bacterium]
ARIRYLLEALQPDGGFDRMPLILARAEINFRSPILFEEEVVVGTRVDHIGRTSFAMSHRMQAGTEGRLVGEVATVLVAYDYAEARPMPVPDEWRRRLAAYEGRALDTDTSRRAPAATPS